MTIEHLIYAYIVGAALYLGFKMGRWYESEELPREQMAKEMAAREDGALSFVAAVYVGKGAEHPDVASLLDSMSSNFPAVRTRWHAMAEGERQTMGAKALVRLADPSVQAEFERAQQERDQVMRELRQEIAAS